MKHMGKIAVIFAALLITVSAFAANKNSVNLTLNDKAMVNGTTLQPGDYKVVLDRDGDNVQATFITKGKEVAKSSGHFEQRTSFVSGVSLVTNNSDHAIQQIVVAKMKGAVVLDSGAASGAAH